MAAAAAPLRCHLSDFPDELLLCILSFLPARDATAAAVLSRRWRSLWLSSGVVYLDSRSFGRSSWQTERNFSFYERRTTQCEDCKGFLRAAAKALAAAAAAAPITRLTFVAKIDSLICRPDVLSDDRDLLAAVLSNPAVRRVEELHVEVEHWSGLPLRFASLPSESLRVLRAVNCSPVAAAPPGAASFPRLAELHLHKYRGVSIAELQPIVDAAPQLATMHLESCIIKGEEKVSHTLPGTMAKSYRLVCPAVTALVFAGCTFVISLELDAPRLRSFRYFGTVQHCDRLSLNPIRPLSVIQVADLHLRDESHAFLDQGCVPSSFWHFIRNFRSAKVLKLKLDFSMARVALKTSQDEVLDGHTTTLFRNLEQLDLDAHYLPGSTASMVTLARLLRGCPVVRDLRLKLSKGLLGRMNERSSLDQEARADFHKSVDRFRHKRSPMCSLGGQDDHDNYYEGAFGHDIHALTEQSFCCLESSLRRVSLHFCMDRPNCLGVQLAKFFAANGRVLEEIHIDDGSHKLCEHMKASISGMDC
ncbi:unnamed protein product [Urochloa decumbens]|uniref:F-box domain-containing protein n=1 Tax=Urochloa decumbens TaxID=240449 RepID=A0ABC9AI88_9POAL